MPPEDFRKVQLYFSYYKQVTDLRDGSDVGNIEWQWRGCKKSLLTDSDVWTMELSPHMDVEKKALMLGGLMLAVSFVHCNPPNMLSDRRPNKGHKITS